MKKLLTAISVAALIGTPAFAADMAVKAPPKAVAPAPVYSWTGFYVGVNAGYGFGTADPSLTFNTAETNFVNATVAPIPSRLRPDGFIGGAEAGYSYQSSNYVFGLETDFSYSDVRGTASATGPAYIGGTLLTTVTTKLDWLGTVRARVGILPTSNVLLYGTGGFAYGDVKTTTAGTNLGPNPAVYSATGTASGISTGWTVGAGLQYAVDPRWLLKVEYLYVDLGKQSVTYPDLKVAGGLLTSTTSFTVNIVRGGIDYRF